MKQYVMCLMAGILSFACTKQEITLVVHNPSAFDRNNEVTDVKIDQKTIARLPELALFDGENNPVAYQLTGEYLLFPANVKAQSEAVYTLKKGTLVVTESLTYAAQKIPEKRNDIAWENDLATYRMYCKTLLPAEPNTSNGVDIWFKKQAAPMIDPMFTYENYHSEQTEGVDAYSVNGKTLGAGGIAAFVNDSLWLHAPYDECEIIANGPLRSEFILHYHNVEIAGDFYCKTVRISTQANGLLNKAVVKYEGKDKPVQLAAGIYLHTNQAPHIPNGVELAADEIIAYAENPSEGHVTSPDPRMYIGVYMPEATDTLTYNHQLLILRNYTIGTEITYYFGGGWNIFPAGRYAADSDWLKALQQFKEMINNPLY